MKTIQFFAPGIPKAQPRARAFARGGMVRVYDPGTAEHWKNAIAVAAPIAQFEKTELPVALNMSFIMPRPKDHYRRGSLRLNMPLFHIKKPDKDNLEKAVMDALTVLGAWKDDSQVCKTFSEKIYGETPGLNIEIIY